MTTEKSTKRAYNSTRRQESALQTRQGIAQAALQLFQQRGYRGASIDAIAEAAAVAPETIYATFGNKREVLHYILDTAVGGDEAPVRVIDRPEVQAMLHHPDPYQIAAGLSEAMSRTWERAAPVFAILSEAAKTEPVLADLRHRIYQERLENMRLTAHSMATRKPLRVSEAQAAEIIWTLTSPEMFLLLTRERGWSREQFAAWLKDSIIRMLFVD